MRYSNGQIVRVGDKVKLGDDSEGVVGCSIDTDEYTVEYLKAKWGYLKRGVVVNFPQHGLIHYEQSEPDLELLERATLT